ncbi:MAG: lysophospholipid acyltransferase family protein [Cytophagales bacterium]|nr:lysophospholipid acyltransferase family protein [Armatimonadota bacterium]
MTAAETATETTIISGGAPEKPQGTKTNRKKFGKPSTRRWQRLVVRLLQFAGGQLQRMPRDRALRWGYRIGKVAYLAGGKQRLYADRNLRLAQFPTHSATARERDRLIRRVFTHFAKTAVDFLRGPALTDNGLQTLVRVEDWHHMGDAIAAGHGVILLTAHLGNWEMLGRYLISRGARLTVIAREPEDPTFGAYLRDLRQSAGFVVRDKGNAARDVLAALKRGDVVGILPDQNSGDVFAPFFGVPAGTPAGPALFALRTGAPIVPGYVVQLPDDTYLARFFPPIVAENTGDRAADVQRIMTEANHRLEGLVREYPDQWLWLHNRWKSAFERKNAARAWAGGTEDADSGAYREALMRWQPQTDK